MIQLKAKFTRAAAAHLVETPVKPRLNYRQPRVDRVIVTATVRDTAQLEWWLAAFGPLVEVQEPAELRQRMIESIVSLFDVYSD
jgi:predicted DNA-binding transcriptional regulator YafY